MNIRYNFNFFILIILSYSCNNTENSILPNSLEIHEINNVFIYPDNITTYDVNTDDISIKEITTHNIVCKENYKTYQWMKFTKLSSGEKSYIFEILEEKNQNQSEQEVVNLMEKIKSNTDIYFCGCYEEMIGISNLKYNFYDLMCFLDVKNKKLYEIKHVD